MVIPKRGRKKIVKKSVKASSAISSLIKRVNTIDRRYKYSQQTILLGSFASNASLQSDYYIFNPMNFNSSQLIFGTGSNDTSSDKAYHKSMTLQFRVSLENPINNEEETIGFTAMLVKLRDTIPDSKYDSATGALTMVPTTDYYMTVGQSMINPKYFQIVKKSTFWLSNYGTALNAPSGQGMLTKQFTWRIKPNNYITNPLGDVKTLSASPDPSKQYYLIIFNNNSIADGENPTVSINCVNSLRSL